MIESVLTRRRLAQATTGLLIARARCGTASPTFLVGDQKGGAKSLMTASGVLAGIDHMIEWNIFAAAEPLLEALNAGAIDCGGVGDAPFAFARAAGVKAKVITATRSSGASTALLVPATSTARTFADLKAARSEPGKAPSAIFWSSLFGKRPVCPLTTSSWPSCRPRMRRPLSLPA